MFQGKWDECRRLAPTRRSLTPDMRTVHARRTPDSRRAKRLCTEAGTGAGAQAEPDTLALLSCTPGMTLCGSKHPLNAQQLIDKRGGELSRLACPLNLLPDGGLVTSWHPPGMTSSVRER